MWWKADIKKVKTIGPDKYLPYMCMPLSIIFYQLLVLENSYNEFPFTSSDDFKSIYGYVYRFLTVCSRKPSTEPEWFITQWYRIDAINSPLEGPNIWKYDTESNYLQYNKTYINKNLATFIHIMSHNWKKNDNAKD